MSDRPGSSSTSGPVVTRDAPAKLNLRLRVLERDATGYHGVETLLLQLVLADRITVAQGEPGIRLEVEGDPDLPPSDDNLCWRAADLLHRELGVDPAVTIRLEKRIPVAAGLGGGSMDAAAVLSALAELPGLAMEPRRLAQLAGELGSDVPFGLCDRAMALGWERGRRLLALDPPPARPVLIAVPPFGVRAADAYAWLQRDRQSGTGDEGGSRQSAGGFLLPSPDLLTDWEVLSRLAVNDLEAPVFRRHPELKVIVEALRAAGARISILCGSGACVAGIFDSVSSRDRTADAFEKRAGVSVVRTSTRGSDPG